MGKKLDIGVSNIARKGKKAWIGVDSKARKIKKMWIGDTNGKARLFFSEGGQFVAIANYWFTASSGGSTSRNCIAIGNADKIDIVLKQPETGGETFYSLAYGNGIFVLTCENTDNAGDYFYSYDGYNWTKASNTNIRKTVLCFANGKFYAFASSKVYTSTDAVTWTELTNGNGKGATFVCFINGYFIVHRRQTGAQYAELFYSKDCITWTSFKQTTYAVQDLIPLSVDDSGNGWVVFPSYYSYNGNYYAYDMFAKAGTTTVSEKGLDNYSGSDERGGCFGDDKFISLEGNRIRTYEPSADGSWSSPNVSNKVTLTELQAYTGGACYCGDTFILFSDDDIATSTDGIAWTVKAVPYSEDTTIRVKPSKIVVKAD